MGNGGSCAIACHFVTDLSFIRSKLKSEKIKISSLCSNLPLISAIANDCGYEKIFLNQLERRAETGDLCIIISSSGNSKNLISAFDFCNKNLISTILILGFNGGELKSLSTQEDLVLHFESEIGHYGPVEDVHQSICHEISLLVKQELGLKN
jgi:D-sedoheptulose 7-phosphate isomerase